MNWEEVWQNFVNWLPNAGIALGKFLLVVVVGIIVEKVAVYLLRKILYKTKIDTAIISFVLSLTKVLLKVVIVILALGALNLDVTALAASLGVIGVALSVAMKDTLSSVASGINIIVNKPFKSGDFVEIGSYSGTIVGIKMMSTEIITGDNKTIIIPNNMVNTSAVVNYSTMDKRRVEINMEVAYGSEIELVKDAMYEAVKAYDKVLPYPDIMIVVSNYGASSIEFKTRFWVQNADYWDAFWTVQENMVKVFNKYGIEIPFNQLDVHLNTVTEKAVTEELPKPAPRPTEPTPAPPEEETDPVKIKIKKIDEMIDARFSKNLKKEEIKREKAEAKRRKNK